MRPLGLCRAEVFGNWGGGVLSREQGTRTHLNRCKPMILAFDHFPRRGGDFVPHADHQTRELARLEREHGEDTRAAGDMVTTAKMAAPRLATMASVSDARDRWVAYQVGKPRVTSSEVPSGDVSNAVYLGRSGPILAIPLRWSVPQAHPSNARAPLRLARDSKGSRDAHARSRGGLTQLDQCITEKAPTSGLRQHPRNEREINALVCLFWISRLVLAYNGADRAERG